MSLSPETFLPSAVQRYSIPLRKIGYPWVELYGALVAATSFLCVGVVQSYTSGAIVSLQNDVTSNISVTKSDISWIASTPPLASLFGTIVIGPVMESLGRKKTITLLAIPYILGWMIIGTAVNVEMIIVGRFSTGFAIGMARACAPIYVSEIVRAEHRGKLGYLPPIMAALGVLMGSVLGSGMNWKQLALMMAAFPTILLLSSIFLPESPHWLIRKNQEDQAFQTLKRLRRRKGICENEESQRIYKEIHEIRESLEEVAASSSCSSSSGGFTHLLLQEPAVRNPAMLVFSLMVFQQFSGVSAVIYYLKMILNYGAGTLPGRNGFWSDMRPGVVGAVHFLSFFISLPLVDRVGRKFLLKVSGVLMALSHITLALYLYYDDPTDTSAAPSNIMRFPRVLSSPAKNSSSVVVNGTTFPSPDAAELSWLPLAALCAYIASFSIASPIPFILMSEFFGANVRSYVCSIATLICSIASFIIVHMFPILMYGVSPTFTFLLFAFFSILNTVVAFIIPETKGKTLAQIENLFRAPRDFRGKPKDIVEIDCVVDCVSVTLPQENCTSNNGSGNDKVRVGGGGGGGRRNSPNNENMSSSSYSTYGALGVRPLVKHFEKF